MTGPAGQPGIRGAKGNPGHDGARGATGHTGKQGIAGHDGARGAAGSTGMRGPRGIDADVEDTAAASGPLAMDFIRKLTLSVLALMVVVVTLLGLYLVTYVQDQRLLSECYRAAFAEQNSALTITVGAAGRDRRGLLALLTFLTDAERSRTQRLADLEEYKRILATSEAERTTNPLLPARTC